MIVGSRRLLRRRERVHGLCSPTAFNTVDVAGASQTLLTRINNRASGRRVLDALSEEHGLTGTR